MHLHAPLRRTPIARWAERTQQHACRNAMVASTALREARRERAEVERYVVGALASRTPRPTQQPVAASG